MQCLPATATGQHPLVPNKPTEPENDATVNSGEEEPTAPNKPTEPTVASEPEPEPEPITMIEEPTEPTEPIEPTEPEPEPITVMEPAVDDTASINGGEDQPKAPAPVSEVVPSNSNQPPADHQKLQEDLACGCHRTKPAAVAAAQALANAGGNCNSPVGQALAQAYDQAVAPGKGQAVARAFARADASSAQKVGGLSTVKAFFVGMLLVSSWICAYSAISRRTSQHTLEATMLLQLGATLQPPAPRLSQAEKKCTIIPKCTAVQTVAIKPWEPTMDMLLIVLPAVPEPSHGQPHQPVNMRRRLCWRLLHQPGPCSWSLLRPRWRAPGHQHQPSCD